MLGAGTAQCKRVREEIDFQKGDRRNVERCRKAAIACIMHRKVFLSLAAVVLLLSLCAVEAASKKKKNVRSFWQRLRHAMCL